LSRFGFYHLHRFCKIHHTAILSGQAQNCTG
jgi:hypothetical protein